MRAHTLLAWHRDEMKQNPKNTLPMNSKSSLFASPRAAGAATVTRTSSAFTPWIQNENTRKKKIQ